MEDKKIKKYRRPSRMVYRSPPRDTVEEAIADLGDVFKAMDEDAVRK